MSDQTAITVVCMVFITPLVMFILLWLISKIKCLGFKDTDFIMNKVVPYLSMISCIVIAGGAYTNTVSTIVTNTQLQRNTVLNSQNSTIALSQRRNEVIKIIAENTFKYPALTDQFGFSWRFQSFKDNYDIDEIAVNQFILICGNIIQLIQDFIIYRTTTLVSDLEFVAFFAQFIVSPVFMKLIETSYSNYSLYTYELIVAIRKVVEKNYLNSSSPWQNEEDFYTSFAIFVKSEDFLKVVTIKV